MNYLEIPLNLVASLGQKGNGLQLVAGPYLAVALKGSGLSRSYPVGPTPPPYGEVDPGSGSPWNRSRTWRVSPAARYERARDRSRSTWAFNR